MALHYGEIKRESQKLPKIKPFNNEYNWERINFPSEKKDWKKFEKKLCNNCS